MSLKYLLANEAQSMLGVYLAPDGNNLKEIEYLKQKTTKWAELVRTHYTNKEAA